MLNWKKYLDEAPPYDTLVLIRNNEKGSYITGHHKMVNWEGPTKWALAYNECYPPHKNMTKVNEEKDNHRTYSEVPFEIYEWAEIE